MERHNPHKLDLQRYESKHKEVRRVGTRPIVSTPGLPTHQLSITHVCPQLDL